MGGGEFTFFKPGKVREVMQAMVEERLERMKRDDELKKEFVALIKTDLSQIQDRQERMLARLAKTRKINQFVRSHLGEIAEFASLPYMVKLFLIAQESFDKEKQFDERIAAGLEPFEDYARELEPEPAAAGV